MSRRLCFTYAGTLFGLALVNFYLAFEDAVGPMQIFLYVLTISSYFGLILSANYPTAPLPSPLLRRIISGAALACLLSLLGASQLGNVSVVLCAIIAFSTAIWVCLVPKRTAAG